MKNMKHLVTGPYKNDCPICHQHNALLPDMWAESDVKPYKCRNTDCQCLFNLVETQEGQRWEEAESYRMPLNFDNPDVY